MPNVMQITHSQLPPGFAWNRQEGNSDLMMFGWNLCSALGLKFIYKHNIFFFFSIIATKSNTEKNPIEACRCLFKLHQKFYFKMSSLQRPGVLIITLTIYLPCLSEGAEAAEHMVSDSFREMLVQFNITCFGQQVGVGLRTHIRTALS